MKMGMKKTIFITSVLVLSLILTACQSGDTETTADTTVEATVETEAETTAEISAETEISDIKEEDSDSTASVIVPTEITAEITLSDDGIKVNGEAVSTDATSEIYTANDIVYYESGKDFTYGEGTESDAHTAEEAAAHTVVHITKAGTYRLSGKLSKGQIAVDLGKDAKKDPDAVVTLILDGIDVTCEVAPAVIFYNVYECGSDDADTAAKDVDTSAAGANVIIADGSNNFINGSHVARIYKPDSVVLSEDGTEVIDEKKLHKYDAAFYSKMSMNLYGESDGSGVLNIVADNEGLGTELHLTLNGGNINITSGNDGINTNEDGVSVTTVNGGTLKITVTGETGEGDGIDSNGWLVINGGNVYAYACSFSADSGIDSDMGIHINGGTVIATGSMLDAIENGGQNYAVFSFANKQNGTEMIDLANEAGGIDLTVIPPNGYQNLIVSFPELKAGTYTLYSNGSQLVGYKSGSIGSFGGMMPDGSNPGSGMMPPENSFVPNGGFTPNQAPTPPEGEEFRPDMQLPGNGQVPSESNVPEFNPPEGDFNRGERPDGEMPNGDKIPNDMNGFPHGDQRPADRTDSVNVELSELFVIADGGNMFSGVKIKE